MSGGKARRPHVELVAIAGNATDTERAAALEAIVALTEEERRAERSSVWLRSARAQGRRLGMYDYRDRFDAADAWRLSTRFPSGGREYPGRNGRGDTK